MTNIQDFQEKIKLFIQNDGVFMVFVLVTVAVAAFGLGRQSVAETRAETTLSYPEAADQESILQTRANPTPLTTVEQAGEQYVASKNGTKYHLETCPGAKQISEENKVHFSSREVAEQQGYTPAANCPALQN